MRILIVDDHPIYAEGLKNLLLSWEYREVGIAGGGSEGVVLAKEMRPDVVLMDISMPGVDGIQATMEIKRENPEVKIVMLTSLGDEESLFRAIKAGASGYLLKTVDGEELVRCLADLKAGRNPFSAGLEESLLSEFQRSHASARGNSPLGTPNLTHRQKEVLRLLAAGNTYKQIAKELYISERTVKFHVEHIKAALGLATREQLIEFMEKG